MKLGPYELNQVHQADVLIGLGRLPESSVHCVVTSPPYWGLRNYGQDGQWGLEATPEEHVTRMVAFGRACRRVLRRDGTLWLNYGDCYVCAAKGSLAGQDKSGLTSTRTQERAPVGVDKLGASFRRDRRPREDDPHKSAPGLKPKDLVGMPWRVAFALQADGWWLRSDIIWFKLNPMPESVRDRPTKAHEYVFLLTKSAKYFYDSEAVKEGISPKTLTVHTTPRKGTGVESAGEKLNAWMEARGGRYHPASRNLRSVWPMATEPYAGAHFSTFPQRLPDICIRAGTSEKGVCPECGAPWVRVVEKSGGTIGRAWHDHSADDVRGKNQYDPTQGKGGLGLQAAKAGNPYRVSTLGWRPMCGCGCEDTMPAIVLDPFAGSGTTGIVAVKLGRDFIGFDLAGGDCDLGGHTPNQRIAAAADGLTLTEYQQGQNTLFPETNQ